MVTRLPMPAFSDVDLIDEVVLQRQNGVNKDFFNGIQDQWKQRILHYVNSGGNPEAVPIWPAVATDAAKRKFLTLYNSPRADSAQLPVLQKIRERTLQLCPSCGEDGTPNTLDHYLPKDIFPEFAIATVNLSPMCDTCQGWKLQHLLDAHGKRLFLHPYFDHFLDAQVVQLDIGEPYSAPASITLTAKVDLDVELRELVNRHLDKLRVETRFYHFFRSEYIRLLGSASDIRAANLNLHQQLNLFCSHARRKSINSWAHIFYQSVLGNQGLMEFLEQGVLPAH